MSDEKPRLGHDPLEWLMDDEDSENLSPAASATATSSASESEVADTPADASEAQTAAPAPEDTTQSEPLNATRAESDTIQLPAQLLISEVEGLAPQWLSVLQNQQTLSIVAEALEDMDGAGLQLLIATVKQAQQQQLPVRISGLSSYMRAKFAVAGVSDFFNPFLVD